MTITRGDALLKESILGLVNVLTRESPLSRTVVRLVERKLYEKLVIKNRLGFPRRIQEDKYYIIRNMFHSLLRAVQQGRISSSVKRGLSKVLVSDIMFNDVNQRERFREKFGHSPPGFLTISPTKMCNLRCKGCYAASSGASPESLSYGVVDRIVREKTQKWGSHFTVISGGEPFLWSDEGKGIIDLAADHPDNFFLVYTNGTLIDEEVVGRLAQVGNITPAISVEGFDAETDFRRGKGVYGKILEAFQNLRQVGVPFGISITAWRGNAELVLSDEFIDFYFGQQGAIYGWIFQYMPIGRRYSLDMMVTPQQRLWMYEREQELVRERKVFIADFWNSGPVSNGCISAGRPGGYFYIDWNGDVMPCVFVPYTTHNIVKVYEEGGDLDTVLGSPFFEAIRRWQREYGYMKRPDQVGNLVAPCVIRDNHREFRKALEEGCARPVDADAGKALRDRGYYEGMVAYGCEVKELTNPIWENEYIDPERKEMAVA